MEMSAKRTLAMQLSLDYCCTADEVLSAENIFTVYCARDGRRRFDGGDDCFLKIAAINGKLMCTGREDIVARLSPALKDYDGRWFMEAGPLARLSEIIAAYGYCVKQVHPFYLASRPTAAATQGLETIWYERDEISRFADDARFDEAFAFCEDAPDVLGVAALSAGKILAMAGASEDSALLWQIGINVEPEAAGRGIGTALVTLMKNAVIERGALPFYGTAVSHIASQRVAIKAGFLPAWTELLTQKRP